MPSSSEQLEPLGAKFDPAGLLLARSGWDTDPAELTRCQAPSVECWGRRHRPTSTHVAFATLHLRLHLLNRTCSDLADVRGRAADGIGGSSQGDDEGA